MGERRPVLLGRIAERRDQGSELLRGARGGERALEQAVVEAAPAGRVPVDERRAGVPVLSREHRSADRVDDPVTARGDLGVGLLPLGDERQSLLAARPVRDVAESLLEAAPRLVARSAVLERRRVCGERACSGVRVEDLARCRRRRRAVARGGASDAERGERQHRDDEERRRAPRRPMLSLRIMPLMSGYRMPAPAVAVPRAL